MAVATTADCTGGWDTTVFFIGGADVACVSAHSTVTGILDFYDTNVAVTTTDTGQILFSLQVLISQTTMPFIPPYAIPVTYGLSMKPRTGFTGGYAWVQRRPQ